MIPEDTDLSTTKEETTASTNDINTCASRISKAVSTAASTSSWSRLKDPRIVRVSRAFGGKDRHSKVCTVRGLRDRRVRLSVPTAIQLYDLQDRLGLNQPSKVVDWLLNEAKEAIDELPPLQIPQGSLISQSNIVHHPMFMNPSQVHSHEFLSPQSDNKINNSSGIDDWGKDKDVSGETSRNWLGRNDNHQEAERSQQQVVQLDPSNFLMSRQSLPFPSLFNGSYNPNLVRCWDPSNLTPSSSHDPQRSSHESSTASQNNQDFHHHHNFSLVQLSSHTPAGSHPVLVYHHQPAAAGVVSTPPFNNASSGRSHILSATNTGGFESKQADSHGLQLSNYSLTSPVDVRPFQFHTTANLLPNSQNRAVDEQSNRNNQSFHSS